MISEILACWCPGPFELIVIFVIFFAVFVIPVFLVILFILYLVKTNKQKKKLHMEVEKLTEEISKLKREKQ